jgi:hypothetical protein
MTPGVAHTFNDRAARMAQIVSGDSRLRHDFPLVKGVSFTESEFSALAGAAATYVWHSLCVAFPGETFELSTDILATARPFLAELPNRTPNGVLLPKAETFVSYNLVQAALVRAFSAHGLVAPFSHFQAPCNVRIVESDTIPTAEKRAYSSSKIHTDVWNGEPQHSVLFNIPLLGDPEHVGMTFFEPSEFPADLVCRLDDYDLGQPVVDGARACDMPFALGDIYVSDSMSLHQTVRRGPGARLSLDFRALSDDVLAGEIVELSETNALYIPSEDWLRTGTREVLYSEEPVDSFQQHQRGIRVEPIPVSLLQIKTVE